MKTHRTTLAEEGHEIQYTCDQDDRDYYDEHRVAISEEVGSIADGVYPVWGEGALEHAFLFLVVAEVEGKTIDALHAHHGTHQDVDIVHAAQGKEGQLYHTE